jgi:hypothetical protein
MRTRATKVEEEIMIPEPYKSAHKDCGPDNNHKEPVLASSKVGCFYCLTIYSPAEIIEWTLDNSVLCPHCGIDSVLPDSEQLSPRFLQEMHNYWF